MSLAADCMSAWFSQRVSNIAAGWALQQNLQADQLLGVLFEQWQACRRMHDEVRVVADSPRLSALTAKTVGKALQLMAEKAEYMTFAGMPC